ncbi:hypothetical protein D9M73_89310 [compost metagenome]
MHRVFGRACKCFEMQSRNLDYIGLRLRQKAEFEQLRTKPIACAWGEGQESAIDQRAGQSVRGALGQIEPFGQIAERQWLVRNRFDHVETAHQRLAAGPDRRFRRGCRACLC